MIEGAEDQFMVAKATIGHYLALPLLLVVDIIAPSTHLDLSLYASFDLRKTKTMSIFLCNVTPPHLNVLHQKH